MTICLNNINFANSIFFLTHDQSHQSLNYQLSNSPFFKLIESQVNYLDITHSYGPLPVISTYNPIYRRYNPKEITSYN